MVPMMVLLLGQLEVVLMLGPLVPVVGPLESLPGPMVVLLLGQLELVLVLLLGQPVMLKHRPQADGAAGLQVLVPMMVLLQLGLHPG